MQVVCRAVQWGAQANGSLAGAADALAYLHDRLAMWCDGASTGAPKCSRVCGSVASGAESRLRVRAIAADCSV
jgi:hypothetical protein